MNAVSSVLSSAWEEISGDGVRLSIAGITYIDCASGTFNLSLGYSNQQVLAAVHRQLDRTAHLSSAFTGEKSAEIFAMLREFLPGHIDRFWFRDIIGSTANECAIRMAQKATGRSEIVSLFLSHHGQSAATASLSGNAFRQRSFALSISDSLKIPAPDCADCFYRQRPESCGLLCATRLEDFLEYASQGRTAALLIEPVLGNGGNIVPPPGYFEALREICDRHGIVVIADEVQTGFGRTGTFFASTGIAEGLRPDIITFAKGAGGVGIPVAGVVMRHELDVLEPWEHSSTSGANPLALVALEETIRYIRDHGVLENVQSLSKVLRSGLEEFERRYPAVTDVRGEGLMRAFDLPDADAVSRFVGIGKKHGLILRGSRYGFGRTVKVRPPLVASRADIDEILTRLAAALEEFAASER